MSPTGEMIPIASDHAGIEMKNRLVAELKKMGYQPDEIRKSQIDQIGQFVAPERESAPNIMRFWGPPGVGKTRLVHRALELAKCQDRVRFSDNSFEVRRWLEDPTTRLSNDLVLVVDEVVAKDAYELAQGFETADKATRACMIMIGPIDIALRVGSVNESVQVEVERKL